MNAYLGIKFHEDNQNRPRIELITQALDSLGIPCTCVRRDVEAWGAVDLGSPQQLMETTFEIIRRCDVTIIDLTEKGVGLGIEAGYAYAISKRVFTIAQAGSDISTTIAGISTDVYHYQNSSDLQNYFHRVFQL